MSEPNTGHSCNIAMTTAWSHAVSWLSQTPLNLICRSFKSKIILSEARPYSGSIEIFRRRRRCRRQPEVGLKTRISQGWSKVSLSDLQAWKL